jgi:hypothetical protein
MAPLFVGILDIWTGVVVEEKDTSMSIQCETGVGVVGW